MQTIETASIPAAPFALGTRRLWGAARTGVIRQALKATGVKGVSIKTSTTGRTDISLRGEVHPACDWSTHIVHECSTCSRNLAAERKITAIVLAALPDLDDRSDSMIDYFDFVFMVSVSNR